ncbi:MAG: nascent polypeptide-associated complex protein [Candidatus Aenigmarchaeota archaeon]|nr:nascent polypeptide-associated complex protein [Candidatus Aenigmarchaeota archaeon]
MKINPKQIEKMAKRMGIEAKPIDATEVIIRTPGKDIVISNPQVSRVNMMGQDSWQITGDVSERPLAEESRITDDDVRMVAMQAGVSEEDARSALEETNGDIAEAILKLKKK